MAKMSAKVLSMPILSAEEKSEDRESWLKNRLLDMGLIMADSQPKTPGFYVNWTNFIGFLFIGLVIVGLFIYTYSATYNSAYQKGLDDAERRSLKERLEKTEADVKKAKELQLYSQGAAESGKSNEEKK